MDVRRWSEIRRLFEAVCELPRERWRERLAELSDDQGAVEEALLLLGAQTQALSRVRNRLDTAIAHAMAPEFDVGQRLGPWRLVERIAHGGMGTVFRAERADGAYQRTVAIKLLHGLPGPAESARLAFERQVLAGLQLPNVAQLYDGGSTPEGHPYLVMEYVSGLALDRWCEQRKPNLRQRLALFVEICRTVQGAHQQLVLHCDLKPGNVLIRDDGHPVLLDFGVARMLNESHDRRLSGYCTPAYASPELMRGEAVGVASDVYSLGVMLVELLSGAPCHHHIDAEEVAVPLPSHNAAAGLKWSGELAGDLDAIAAKACSAQAAQRYRSVGALIADIRRYLGREPVGARGGGRYYRARLALRRNWQSWVAGVAVLVLVGVFVSNLLQARRQAEEEAAVARQVSSFLIGAFETTDPRRRDNPGEGELTARQLLDNAAIKVSTDLADAPTQLARMRSVLGLAYQNLGLPQRAEQLLRDAVDGLLDGRVNRGADAALALAELSMQKTRNGDGGQGLQLAEQALELLKRDPSAPLSARLQHARGFALVNLQRYPDGEQALKTALELYTALPAFEAQEGLHNVRYDLALMYWRWGRLQPAEQQFRALLGELGDRDAGIRHSVQTRLAQVLREQGRYAEALPLLQQELAYASRLYGEDSSFVLLQHEALADLYQDQGDYLAAELQYQAVTGLAGRLYGEQSLQRSMALYNHACLRNLRGDVASAERLFRQALAIRRARLGTEAAMSLRAEVGLGLLLFDQARLDEAGILLKHADAGLAAMLPEDAPGRIEARLAWLRWQIQHGDLDTARELLQAMELSGAVLPLRIQFFATQAALFERSGQAGAALGARRSAAQLARSLYGPENPNAALVAVGLGESLLRLGHPGLALAELRAAVPILRRHLSSDSAQLRKAEGLLLLARTGAHRRG